MDRSNFSAARGDLRGCESSKQVADTLKAIIAECETFADYYHMREEVAYLAGARTISSNQADELRSLINAGAGVKLC